jgi:hypothetical protein
MHPLVCGYDESTTHLLMHMNKWLDHHFRAQGYNHRCQAVCEPGIFNQDLQRRAVGSSTASNGNFSVLANLFLLRAEEVCSSFLGSALARDIVPDRDHTTQFINEPCDSIECG